LPSDVAELAERLAPIFGQDVPDLLGDILRPELERLRPEAARILLGEDGAGPKPKRRPPSGAA